MGPRYSSRAGEKISLIRVTGCPSRQKIYSLPQKGPSCPNRLKEKTHQLISRAREALTPDLAQELAKTYTDSTVTCSRSFRQMSISKAFDRCKMHNMVNNLGWYCI